MLECDTDQSARQHGWSVLAHCLAFKSLGSKAFLSGSPCSQIPKHLRDSARGRTATAQTLSPGSLAGSRNTPLSFCSSPAWRPLRTHNKLDQTEHKAVASNSISGKRKCCPVNQRGTVTSNNIYTYGALTETFFIFFLFLITESV